MCKPLTRTLFLLCLLAALARAQASVPKLSEAYRHYCFDFNWVDKLDREGRPLADYSRMRAEDHIRHLVEMKANALMVFTMSISGYMFYDSKVGERHPTLHYDYLREMVRLGHERGIAMELYVPTIWADRLIQKNPSWGVRNPDGTLYTGSYGGYHPDPNSPAADWFVEVIRELIPAYHGQAFFADGLSFLRYGQSEYTVKKFREEMGRPYPRSLEEDPDWRATLRWEVAQIEKFWRKLRDAVKQQDPRVEVTFNGPGPNIQMPGQTGYRKFVPTPPSLNQLTDYVFTEAGSTGEFATWTRGVAWPKPFKVTFLNRHSVLDPFGADEIRARIGRTLAAGGQPYRYDRTSVNGDPNEHFTRSWAVIFDEVMRKEPYVKGAEPVPYVAVLTSEPTMLYRGRSDASSHANELIAALKVLDALHIQHDVVADWNLRAEVLKPYQLLILPNAACMSDAQVQAVRDWVAQGGSLLATAESSLMDEHCAPRPDFALGDVFGVRVDEPVSNAVQEADRKGPTYIHPGMDRHTLLEGLPGTELIFPGDAVAARPREGRPLARQISDAGTPMHAPWRPTERAAIHLNGFGKGRAVWVAASLFARSRHHDLVFGVRWTDGLIRNLVRALAPEAPWQLEASERIWAGLNRQQDERRHVLHLVNWQTDLVARDVPVRIARRLMPARRARLIWPEQRDLPTAAEGAWIRLTVPRVGPHVMVTLE